MRLLVVDDDVELCALLGEFLHREGYTVQFEHEGRAGLSQAELGGRFGLTEQFVISYEDGSRLLDPAEYLAICRAIGVDPYRVLRDAERSAGGDACG